MTEQHPAVVYLLAAHAEAEKLANASDGGRWVVAEMADCGCCSLVRNETGGLVTTADLDDAPLIAEHANPSATLRRVAADRRILAEHQPHEDRPWCCRVCITDREDLYPEQWESDRWPCATVLDLAAGWGWETET